MTDFILLNAHIVDDGRNFIGYIGVRNGRIDIVGEGMPQVELTDSYPLLENLDGKYVFPGIIDDQVHFREPGLTHKADIASESRAAAAGGVTSFMDMPNTNPQTVTIDAWKNKMHRASEVSRVNYSFYLGATNDNSDEIESADFRYIPGVKVFLGASTGNMLVDSDTALETIFSSEHIVAIHSEDEKIIRKNAEHYSEIYGKGNIPIQFHQYIRSEEACLASTQRAVDRAHRLGTRLHILHISTADELKLLDCGPLSGKKITGEVCVHHLWFSDKDYSRLGTKIKWNPAVKTAADREALIEGVRTGKIDIVATDHAPHLLQEKQGDCLTAASGGPMVQHSLLVMLELSRQGNFSIEKVIETMANNPARLFGIVDRGFIRKGYYADLVVVDQFKPYTVNSENILSKCGWSPLEGETFSHSIAATYVNGKKVYDGVRIDDGIRGSVLEFKCDCC